MVPTRSASYAARVNLHLAKSLDAEVILVSAPENEVLTELSGRVELQAQLFGGPKDPKMLGVILNKVRTDESMEAFSARLKSIRRCCAAASSACWAASRTSRNSTRRAPATSPT